MDTVLRIYGLKTFFNAREGVCKAVNNVKFSVKRGEVLGVVGESGCGKSMTSLSILRLVPYPGKIVQGKILLNDEDLLRLSEKEMRQIRGNRISMIFQEPMISLNPAFTIGNQLMEALRIHRMVSRKEARNRAIEMLQMVEIPAPEKRIKSYPHQLSGGMRQRVMIAEALLLNPEILIADEPTTALDVTIQAQILDIMLKTTQETGTAIILITHNLGLVAEAAQRVVVMYAGKIVEEGTVRSIFENARHPYTQGLLRSIPTIGEESQQQKPLYEIEGIVPSLYDLPAGCSFHPRCPKALAICLKEKPPRLTVGSEHLTTCWRYAE